MERDENSRAVHGEVKDCPVGLGHFVDEVFPGYPVGDVAPHDGGHEEDDTYSDGIKW